MKSRTKNIIQDVSIDAVNYTELLQKALLAFNYIFKVFTGDPLLFLEIIKTMPENLGNNILYNQIIIYNINE